MQSKDKILPSTALRPICVVIVLVLLLFLQTEETQARVVDSIKITPAAEGYRLTATFLFDLRYQSHTPDEASREFRVQLRPVNFQNLTDEEVDSLRERDSLSWDYATGIPLEEVVFEGDDPERPQITFRFSTEVELEVQLNVVPTELVILVKVKEPVSVEPINEIEMPEEVIPEDEELAGLMKEARDALIKSDNSRAVLLYTKVLRTAEGEIKKQAQELLGLARERNGQFAHAKAEYQKYLKEYPEGPDAERVRQRLAGLVTAVKPPKTPLRDIVSSTRIEQKLSKWDTRIYGRLSEFYFYDQTTPENGDRRMNRSDLRTDLDLNARWRNKNYDMLFQFFGSRTNDLQSGEEDDRLSKLSLSVRNHEWFAKIGRQIRTSGGVLGRFDGLHLAHDLSPTMTINGVLGYPVESSRQTYVETDKEFYGVSLDLGTYADKWDFTMFFIKQYNHDVIDRQSVGGEVRYFDQQTSFFSLVDYDVMFNQLNSFLLNSYLKAADKTTINVILDYRQSPLLMTNNAIIGQGVQDLSDLFGIFTNEELRQLAEDRTAVSKSSTFGLTQDIQHDFQLTGEVTFSELESTPTSGGVAGTAGTGTDVAYLIQSIFTNAFKENCVVVSGFRYSDMQDSDIYSVNLNCRLPCGRKLRLIPRVRFDHRDGKDTRGDRDTVRSSLRIDYLVEKWIRLDVETGFQWMDDRQSGVSNRSTDIFVIAGLHMYF